MRIFRPFSLWVFSFLLCLASATDGEGPVYDYSAYTECQAQPEEPLYDGGIIRDQASDVQQSFYSNSTVFNLYNLTHGIYCFSCWVKLTSTDAAGSALVRASLTTEATAYNCIGSVLAKTGCWSFLKGGFVLNRPSDSSRLFFQAFNGRNLSMSISSASLQPFTEQEWRMKQQNTTETERKRAVIIHVADAQGDRLEGANITVKQVAKDFPFGSAIAKTILGNLPYQDWFRKRFNAAVFENELKWYATEPKQGQVNYTLADQMLEFVRANQIVVRGHNIFWEDPIYTPAWVRNLSGPDLKSAVNSRIKSLLSRYKEEFVHWDVSNEMLHFDFYEDRLGANASLDFFKIAQQTDPLATVFMNDFNVVETCSDENSTVDSYILRLKEFQQGGVAMDGIGLEGHFTVPNAPLTRAIIDKLATLKLPIWLTEVDISNKLDQETQANYLEQVLREGFSHPAVNGIMLWTAIHPNGCYQMCLTDNNFENLPAGDVVDKLLQEWQTARVAGQTDEHGAFSFNGFLGEYKVRVSYENRTSRSRFALCAGDETRHYSIQL